MSLLRTHMPTGPLVVGCCDVMIGKTKEGSLMRLFYPTSAKQLPKDEQIWTQWFLGEEYSRGIAKFVMPYALQGIAARLFSWQTRTSIVPSVWCGDVAGSISSSTGEEKDAVVPLNSKLPVIVFSHGLAASRGFYNSVCCTLASHGYLVAALEHRDGSACSSFTLNDKGEKEWMKYEVHKPGDKDFVLRSRQIETRIEESRRTLTVLEQLNAGEVLNELESPFELQQLVGRLDLSRPIMAGHSFGGCTAIGTMNKDSRFKLCIALDPWLFPIKDKAKIICPGVNAPILCISTEVFQTPANLDAMKNLPEKFATFVTIKGTVHQNQTDTPFLLGVAGRMMGGTRSKLDHTTAMEINNALMLAFIHVHHGFPSELCSETYAEKCKALLEQHKEKLVYKLYGIGKKMLGWDGFQRV